MFLSFYLLALVGSAWLRIIPPVRALQGDGHCGFYLCVNATVHDDVVTYEMTALKEPLGWLALGFGQRMQDTHMVIMWSNEDGSTTLSQRMAFGHFEPLPAEYPPRRAEVAEPRVSTLWHPQAIKTLAFSIPVNKTVMSWSNPTEHLIWAYGKVQPEKPSYSQLAQHYIAGSLMLNLGGTMPEHVPTVKPAPHQNEAGHTPGASEHDKHQRIIIMHGLLGSIGFLILLPVGVLSARWGRTFTLKWFGAHKTINFSIAFPVITLGWIVGLISVFSQEGRRLFDDMHQITGVLLVTLYYLQIALGRYIHRRRENAPSTMRLHPPTNIFHIILGISIIAIAFAQVLSGMREWKMFTGDSHIAHWCHMLWKIWVVALPVAYLTGMLLLRRQFFQERLGMTPGVTTYIPLFPGDSEHHPVFQVSNDSDEVIDKSLSVQMPKEVARKDLESSLPLLRDQRT
ncbi:hypothetical protein E4T56_gene2850 [Termitomyces sp. T112]|nr:hypothetical protein E4T56_gene2850 [Termitomyces sp. T112]KAH0584246.1 hypothetical protein H2248_009798 [Termitomyces sp. 'cryptogamus']